MDAEPTIHGGHLRPESAYNVDLTLGQRWLEACSLYRLRVLFVPILRH
jgi:hypothetical protein